jgi:hypothetical protein
MSAPAAICASAGILPPALPSARRSAGRAIGRAEAFDPRRACCKLHRRAFLLLTIQGPAHAE